MSRASFVARSLALLGLGVAMNVQAMNCSIVSSPQFSFGHYDPLSPVALDVQASLLVQCTPAFPGQVLNLQASIAGITQPMQMQGIQTSEWLRFSLYADPARTRPIDGQQLLLVRFPLVTTMLLSLPVYGRIPARQPVSVGNYRMDFSVVLDY